MTLYDKKDIQLKFSFLQLTGAYEGNKKSTLFVFIRYFNVWQSKLDLNIQLHVFFLCYVLRRPSNSDVMYEVILERHDGSVGIILNVSLSQLDDVPPLKSV